MVEASKTSDPGLTFISRSEIRCIQEQILLLFLFLFLFTTFYLVIHPDVVAVTDGVILHGGYGLCMYTGFTGNSGNLGNVR